jgi:putative DNA primase/helicase
VNEDSAPGGAETPSLRPDPSQLEPLKGAGLRLIPLHKYDKTVRTQKGLAERGKVPRDFDWTKKDYSDFDAEHHMRSTKGNVGVRLSADLLVIDVDPRNFRNGESLNTDNPFSRLCNAAGIDPEGYPTVRTGGGGFHLYMRKPVDVEIRGGLPDEYPGVEFKTEGRQVVAPGSLHPGTGQHYRWQNECGIGFLGVPPAPEALLKLIERKPVRPERADREANYEDCIDVEQIEAMLEVLDPEDFDDNESWFRLMCACHEASGGAAEDAFVSWSAGDPAYAHDEESVRSRWRSLGKPRSGPAITRRTLFKLVREAGHAELLPAYSEALPDRAPLTIARHFLEERPPTLFSRGTWYEYDDHLNVYRAVDETECIRAALYPWLQGRSYISFEKVRLTEQTLVANRSLVGEVMEAMRAECAGAREPHTWISHEPGDPPADEIIVCRNGLLHVPSRKLLPKTSRFFGVNSMPVDFDSGAARPLRFERFMEEIFPDEPDCIEGMQEMVGLLLTRDVSHHKIFQVIGPPRSGKGTITRVIQSLVGEGNYTSPSAANLAGRFGLAPLMDKQLAVVTDMRLGKGVNRDSLLQTLLRVAGEDSVSIERKGIDNVEVTLPTRFLLMSNEPMQVFDTSDAIGERMVLFVMRQSFVGREDHGLQKDLDRELPGILNWALDGLDRLQARGRFVQPESARPELEEIRRMTSPIKHYVEERLVVGADYTVDKDRLYQDFTDWCCDQGIPYRRSKNHFYRDINTAGYNTTTERPRQTGSDDRPRHLRGLGFKIDYPF